MTRDWEDAVAAIAGVLHVQPSEIWMMDVEDLRFWVARAEWWNERRKD